MGKWQDSAKQSIVNRNSDTSSQSNTANAGAKSSGSWQQQAKQSLDSRGYIPPENRAYEIKLNNGTNFGTVSYGAYKAIQNDTLDKYVPKNDDEKNTLDSFKAYVKEQAQKQEEKEKQNRINSNSVTKKYGIDPDNFTQKDFEKWAEEHGFEYRMGGNDLTGAEYKWLPKQKGGWKFWEVVPSKEEQSDKKALEALAENNQRKAASKTDKGAVSAAVVNAIDGLTFGAVNAYADWDAKRDYKKAGFDENDFVSYSQAQEKTNSEHKVASIVGNVAGSLVSLGGLSKAVGAATSGVKWIAKAPGWVQSAINSGITFAVQSGAETAFDGGNFEDVLKSAGINLVGGAVGGGVSSKVGSIGEKLLFDKGLQHKVIPEMIRTGISSAAFAGSKTASTYFLYPEDYRPTKEEMAKDITTAFAFGAISSGINTIKTSSQNKKYLDGLYQKMAADYESMAKANISGKDDTAGIQKFAKNVIGYSNAMESYLTGKEYNATIDGNTYKFTPNKIRMVGQNKYVEAMLGEINTIRNNANAVLNGIGTPAAGIAVTSAPPNNANTPAVAAPTSKTVSASGNIPVPSVPDTTGVTSAAAAEGISTQNSPIVNTAVSETAVKTNTGGELGKAMRREPVAAFAPETASSEIKRLENILVAKGADDKSRQEAITAALEVEKALTGSNKDILNVFKDVSKITSDAVAEIKSRVGASGAYWKLFGENFKAIPSENTNESINLVIEYANAYTEALKENNPEKYNSVIVSADGTDLSAELPRTIMQNIIPASVKNVGAYRLAAAQIKNIVKNVDLQISNERAEIYGAETENTPVSVGDAFKDTKTGNTITVLERDAENTAVEIDTGTKIETRKISNNQADSLVTSEQFEQIENTETTPQNITLTKMGDFYEAYGNEAVELANKLNLNLTTKTVNGKRVQMVGFPVSSLERYTQALGSGYNISVSDTASVTTQMTQNTPVHTENTVVNEDTTDTGIINHAKEVDGIKLIDTEESTLINGKTLITGVYELNSDKDFDRKSYRKEKLDYFRKAGNPWTETVNGTTYGHYGFYKYKDGRYLVMHLPTGMGITDTKTESKAKSLIKALDDNLPELPLNIKAFGDEYRCSGMTQEISVSIKSIINSADEPVVKEIQDGKVPFSTKAGLVEYVKTHIGDKVRVTFDNGVSEVRTLESISNASMRTKKPDGSDSFTDLKGIKYSDNGFSIDFGTGVSVAYDFINTTEMPESVTEPAERLTENTDSVTETPENESAVSYTDKEKRNWKNSNTIIVYESDEQFENFVEKVLNNEDTHKKIYFGKIPDATAQMVLDKTGVDVSEHNIALKGYEIRKILANSHGDEEAEATRGQEPITTDDLKNIPSVITNPDDVNLSDKKYEGKPALLFEKTIDGKNYVVAYVSKKHHDIAIQTMYKKRSLATAENANALSSTPETTSSTASNNSVSQDIGIVNNSVRNNVENDTSEAYNIAFFEKLNSALRKGESIPLKDVRTAVETLLTNNGEIIKTELSKLKNDELKKRISIYDRGHATKKAEMVESIYTNMLSNLYYTLSGKDTITYIYAGNSFDTQQTKMLLDLLRKLTDETFGERLAENAEKNKKQLAVREEKITRVKNPQSLEDFAYKKKYFGLSDEETIHYEKLYAEERRKARNKKKVPSLAESIKEADSFFANADNYTIEKTSHTKTGEDVWVVRPAGRLEIGRWKQLNEQMKTLGGSYWRGNQGWNFKKDPTAVLNSTKETEAIKDSVGAEKLRAVAEGMQKAIDDKFKNRLTNTAKRAREAAAAEAEGERLKMLQGTINNIAATIENGGDTLLDKIDSKAQVETLMGMLRTSRRNRISDTMSDISYNERLKEHEKPYSDNDVKYAEYPLTKLHENIVNEYIHSAEGKTGYKQITERLKKSLKYVKNGYIIVNSQIFSDIDKIVKNLSTIRADYWNEGVLERKRLARMGIENVVELRAYLREFIDFLPGKDVDAERQRNIKSKERELTNAKIDGFFPTPKTIVEDMLDEADIQPGEKVLEPSAGKGNIADVIRETYPDNTLDVVELNASLNELLSEKGYNVVGNNFLKTSGKYDKIIMNPPFEKGQDIDHIKHAYSLLNDGGRVVCIMSEGTFYRSDKKAVAFREWLENVGGISEKLPDGAFKNAERSTGVNTRMVIIDKAAEYAPKVENTIGRSDKSVHSSRDLSAKSNSNRGSSGVEEIKIEPLARKSGKNPVNSVNAISSFDNSSISQSEDVGNHQPMQEPEKDSQSQQGKSYTYKALTQKSDMKVTLLDSHNIYDETGKMDRHLLLDKAIENVKSKNNPKNTAEKNFVYVPDIDRDVLVGRKGLSHGLSRNANITALVTTKIGDIVENSIKVNELKPRNNTAGGYVLLGIAKDNKNNYYPVRIIVNNYAVDNVEILDVLYAVNAKKKGQFSNETELPANAVPPIKDPSTISVADLIEAVKDNFSDVLTDDVLNNVGAKRRKSLLSESMVYKDVANDDTSRWSTERVEGNKNSNVNIADIVKIIRDKFDIPISTGKVTDNKASGIYKEKPEIIRTRIANNLPTISHELGHHLDKKYDLSKLESVKELRKVVSEEFLKQYPANAKNSEAVAEFVRVYLKNTNEANRLCPEFYSDFIGTLSKEDLKAVNEIASSVNEYMSYNISERYDAAIVSSQKRERVPFGDKWHKWYSDWVDSFHPQKQVVDYVEDITGKSLSGKNNAYVLATNSLNAHTIANFLICEGFRDLDGNIIDAKSFVDSIGMVDSKNVKLLDKYLVLRHSLEWIAPEQEDVKVKRVFADDTLENVEEIKKQIAEIEKAHPEIKTAAENLYEYQNNVLKHFVIPAGGMTDDTLRELNRMYPSYVPFYRAKGKKTGLAKGTFANQRSPIMRAKGSGELIISPTESIIRNTEKMVKYALRNQVMQELANYADNVDGFGQFMEKVPPDMIPHTVNIREMKESFTDALQQVVNSGEDYFAVSDLFEELFGDTVTDFTPVANANKRIVTVMKGGKPSYYQIHNEEFYKSVAELAPQQVNGLLKISQTVMQPMKLLITQNNPVFAVTNAIRDYGTAYKLSEINNPVVFAQKYIQALGGIISNSDAYKQYKSMGGGHSSELSANIGNISKTLRDVAQKDMGKARRLAYSVFRHPVETVASLNDVIESTPRFMEFQRTLESGGDLQQAIYNADDITTNFKKSGKGAMAKSVNKLVMFNNAAIQGLDKLFRTITDKDSKKRYKTLLKWLLNALIMGVIGWLWNKEVDEEGYKNLSSYKKNNFYNFAIGDGKFISLPKPRENALLDTFTERTIEYLAGENKEAFYDFGNYLTSQLLPPMLPDTLNPIDATHSVLGGTVLGGLIDVGFNRDFKGTPIEGEYDKYNPINERYTESTTKLAYGLGQTKLARDLDMSPKKIDHLISSYTGILGQVNKAVFPMNDSSRDTSLGLRNKFISDSNYSTDVLNRMYENQEKAERAFNYSGSVGDAVEYENNSIITSYISGMNKAIKALPEEEQRNGRTYLLKSLNSWNYEDTASQLNMLSNLDGQTIDRNAIFDTLPSSTLEWTVDKQKYVYQMTPQEYHKYISNYLAIIENARKHYGRNTVESYETAKTAANKYMSEYKKNVLKRQYLSKATAKTE